MCLVIQLLYGYICGTPECLNGIKMLKKKKVKHYIEFIFILDVNAIWFLTEFN